MGLHKSLPPTVLSILIWVTSLTAQIEYSGFADILYNHDLSDDGVSGFSYGQFEVDLSAAVMEGVTFEGALAYNADDGVFEAGAGFFDIQLLGSDSDVDHDGLIKQSGLMIGQFDVPFGIDYLQIPSPDRLLVSGPLLNQKTIDGWNDVGLNLYGELSFLNFNLFAVNGWQNGFALGGRLGLPVGDLLELGASFSTQTTENDTGATPNILGLDLQAKLGSITTRLEYQQANAIEEGNVDALTNTHEHKGYYLEVDLDLEPALNLPLFAVGRYGGWKMDEDDMERITAGLGYRVVEVFQLRVEYLSDSDTEGEKQNIITVQTVISF